MRLTNYYGWFGALNAPNWSQTGITPATHYNPTAGFYNLDQQPDSAAVLADQIAAMEYAKFDGALYSWWGQGSATDERFQACLDASVGTSLKWAIYYEPAYSASTWASDLNYIYNHYASHPNYLTVGAPASSRPVLFVYGTAAAGPYKDAALIQGNAGQFWLNLQVYGGQPSYKTLSPQPDGWHQYNPNVHADHQPGFSYSVSPGWWRYDQSSPVLVRDTARFAADVAAMVASNEPVQLVTTFNEWGEGTSVENAKEWQSASGMGVYLDILHGA